jgi:hypothetical protein
MIAAEPFTRSMPGQKKKGATKTPPTKKKQIKKKGA